MLGTSTTSWWQNGSEHAGGYCPQCCEQSWSCFNRVSRPSGAAGSVGFSSRVEGPGCDEPPWVGDDTTLPVGPGDASALLGPPRVGVVRRWSFSRKRPMPAKHKSRTSAPIACARLGSVDDSATRITPVSSVTPVQSGSTRALMTAIPRADPAPTMSSPWTATHGPSGICRCSGSPRPHGRCRSLASWALQPITGSPR